MKGFQSSFSIVILSVFPQLEQMHAWLLPAMKRPYRSSNVHLAVSTNVFDVSIWNQDHWEIPVPTDASYLKEIQQTWNWCRHFVVQFGLCPWALQSTETKHAIHIHVVNDRKFLEDAVELAAYHFHQSKKDPRSAISFVILTDYIPFAEFYNRFMDLEDEFLDDNDDYDNGKDEESFRTAVTLAPFHPDWTFAGENDDDTDDDDDDDLALSFEKRSPYATISIVAAQAIEEAGPAATEHIALHNARILKSRTVEEWQTIYDAAIQANEKSD